MKVLQCFKKLVWGIGWLVTHVLELVIGKLDSTLWLNRNQQRKEVGRAVTCSPLKR